MNFKPEWSRRALWLMMAIDICGINGVIVQDIGPNSPLASEKECGQFTNNTGFQSRVAKGNSSSPGHFPSFAPIGLDIKQPQKFHICGGVFLGKQIVLTAAHCITTENRQTKDLFVGHNIYPSDQWQKRGIKPIGVTKVCISPHFCDDCRPDLDPKHDYAILILEKPVAYNQNLKPACLARRALKTDDKLVAVGLGYSLPGYKKRPAVLQFTKPEYTRVIWGLGAEFRTYNSMMCVGDSGSGIYRLDDGKMTLVSLFATMDYHTSGGCGDYVRGPDVFINRNAIIGLAEVCYSQSMSR